MLLQTIRGQHALHRTIKALVNAGSDRSHALVEDVELLGRRVLLEQLRRHLALSSQDDAILGQYSNSSSGMGDGFQSVLDLVETALWREDGCLGRVSAMASQRRPAAPRLGSSQLWLGPASGRGPAPAQTYSGIVSSRHDCSFPAEPESNVGEYGGGLIAGRVGEEECWWDGMGCAGVEKVCEVVW